MNEAGIAAASGSTFNVTWTGTPYAERYMSGFYTGVDQTNPIGAQAENFADAATPNPITTSALTNSSGDMVIAAAGGVGLDSYTALNGFTRQLEQQANGGCGDCFTHAVADKAATGANETPSIQHTGSMESQQIIGFVLQAGSSNAIPTVASAIADTTVVEDNAPIDNYRDLKAVFTDTEDGSALTYSIESNTNTGLVTATIVVADSTLDLSFTASTGGSATITVRATDSGGLWVEDVFTVMTSCPAGSVCWDGGGGGDPNWSNGLNWTGDVVPGYSALVVFNHLSTNPATFNAVDTIGGFTIEAGYTGTITMAADLLIDHTTGCTFTQNGGTIDLESVTWEHECPWTHTAGTFTAGTSTVKYRYSHIAMDAGTSVFNDVSIGIGNTDFTVTDTMHVNGNLTITGIRTTTGTIAVKGNVTTTDLSATGSGTITLVGDGAQVLSASGFTGSLPGIHIDQEVGGTLAIQDTIKINGYLGAGWTYTNGTVDAGTSTVVVATAMTVNSGSMAFNNVILDSTTGMDLTVTGTMDVDGDLTITTVRNVKSGTITVAGDLTSTQTGVGNNTGFIILDGANAQSIDINLGDVPDGLFTINKTSQSDIVTLSSAMNLSASGQDLTLTSGTLDMAGFNLAVTDVLTLESGTQICRNGGVESYTTLTNNGGTISDACNAAPTVASAIADTTVSESSSAIDNYRDLKAVFTDVEDGSGLTYTIQSNTNSGLVTPTIVAADSTLDLSFTASTSGTATITIRATDSGSSFVDDVFTVTVTDQTAPDAATTLATGTVTASSVQLSWTAPGDDGATGTATTYDVRYSTSTITERNWASATQATGEPSPQVASSSESFTVTGLSSGTIYYFAIKTSDEVPNESAISNVPSAATSAAGINWGRDVQNAQNVTSSHSRSMGGTSPNTDGMLIDTISIYLGAQTGDVRLAVYTGGTEADASSATLLWDAGTVNPMGTAGWYSIGHPSGGVAWPKNTVTWLAWKRDTGVHVYYSNSTADAGDFQTARGRNNNSFSPSPGVAYPGTYGAGTFNGAWYSLYVVHKIEGTPPAAVTNLATGTVTTSSVALSWTAPGDDGATGTATTYDVRYSTSTITAGNWAAATQATGEPAPSVAGSAETFTVTGLSESTTYYFAIKTSDEVPNVSAISNVPSAVTSDATAPAAVTALATGTVTTSSVQLSWTAPGDDGATGTATTYDVRYSTSTITEGNWASATQATGEPSPQVAGSAESFTVTGLSPATTYYFAVKTSDEVPNESAISNVPSAATSTDATAPNAVAALATGTVTASSIALSWTAPGDDGATGTATTYDVRYSTSTINDGNWASATQATGEPSPQVAGSSESFTVTGLSASTTYYFAIKTSDESAISNVPSGTTSASAGVTFQQGDGKLNGASDTDDARLLQSDADTNYGSLDRLDVDDGGSLHEHSVVKFPNLFGGGVDQIPLGSSITSATLTLEANNSGDNVLVYQLIEGWVEATVTWNEANTGVSWTDAGADGTGSRKATAVGTLTAPSGSTSVDVTASVQNWSFGELNEGWLLKDTDTDGVDIRSSEYATAAVRPKLTVTWSANTTPAVAAAIPDTTVAMDAPPIDNYRDLKAVFADVEEGSALTYTIQSNTNSGLVTPTIVAADSTLDLSFTASTTGTATITVRATDSGALFVDDVFTVTVNGPPTVASAIADTTVSRDAPPIDNYRDLKAVFTDAEDGSALTYTIQSNTNSGLVTPTIVAADSTLDLSFTASTSGTATITVRATDSGALFVDDVFTVTVNATPTVASAIPDTTVAMDAAPIDNYRDLKAVFTDAEDGSALTYTIQSNTNSGLVTPTIVAADSTLDLSFTASTTGTATITVRATDSRALFVDDAFTVTVADQMPPNAIANLGAGGASTSSVQLTWTAPGDDGAHGDRHYLRRPLLYDHDHRGQLGFSHASDG